jgi:hypothetical protein
MSNVINLSSQAMIASLNISIWTARKLDKEVSKKVDAEASTLTKAGNYNKKLLPDDKMLEEIQKIASAARCSHMRMTSAWNDAGGRLLTTDYFLKYKDVMSEYKRDFESAVGVFLPEYNLRISAAAFQLGKLFNRDEYPDVSQIQNKFRFEVSYAPLPESGDFRIDITNEAVAELREQYEKKYEEGISRVMDEAWDRLYQILLRLSNSLRVEEDGTKGRIYTSTLETASELVEMLKSLNVRKDTKLEDMRQKLESALDGVSVQDIKDSDYVRSSIKQQVDDLLDKWN